MGITSLRIWLPKWQSDRDGRGGPLLLVIGVGAEGEAEEAEVVAKGPQHGGVAWPGFLSSTGGGVPSAVLWSVCSSFGSSLGPTHTIWEMVSALHPRPHRGGGGWQGLPCLPIALRQQTFVKRGLGLTSSRRPSQWGQTSDTACGWR